MTAKTLGELALKVWGVLLVLASLLSLPTVLWMAWTVAPGDASAGFARATQIGYVSNSILQGLGGLALLVWADRIVALFESDEAPLSIDVSYAQLQVLSLGIVGVVVLIDGLQNAVAAAYVLLTKPDVYDTASYMWSRQGENVIKGVVQIAAGVLLVFGREALARRWSRLRSQPAPGDAGLDNGN